MRKMPILGPSICLLLDIIGFIVVSLIALGTTNIFLLLVLGLFIYTFAYDATKATIYIINHFKK